MQLGILKLPEAFTINSDSKFIVYKKTGTLYVTDKILFSNLLFGPNNVTFYHTISTNISNTDFLTTTLDNLSSDVNTQTNLLSSYIVNFVNKMFTNLMVDSQPIGFVKYTVDNINPSTYIPNTTWSLLSGGYFIGGVGTNTDKNSNTVTFNAGVDANNFNLAETSHNLSVGELPAHTHTATQTQETNASVAGLYTESANSPTGTGIAASTSTSTGGGIAHNNIPPFYGLYAWERIA